MEYNDDWIRSVLREKDKKDKKLWEYIYNLEKRVQQLEARPYYYPQYTPPTYTPLPYYPICTCRTSNASCY